MAPDFPFRRGATLEAAERVCAASPTTRNLGRRHAEAEAGFQAAADILAGLGERWGQAVALGGLGRDCPVSRPTSRFSVPVSDSSTDAYCLVSPVSCRT